MIMGRQSGLGKGLGALIPPKPQQSVHTSPYPVVPPASASPAPTPAPAAPAPAPAPVEPRVSTPAPTPVAAPKPPTPATAGQGVDVARIPIESIERNPHQPRIQFDQEELDELMMSVKEHGILQPIVVSTLPNGKYELIAGERRFRAATLAGLTHVPAVIRSASERQKLEWAIIENVLRQDLNPVEEAKAYTRLMDEFRLTQEEVSKRMGKSRSQIANIVRLLQLPQEIQDGLSKRSITMSQARTLLALPTDKERVELYRTMTTGGLTVRDAEDAVTKRVGRRRIARDPQSADIEADLRNRYGTRVDVSRKPTGQGEVRFRFFSEEEFGQLLAKLLLPKADSEDNEEEE